jgi:hypothetical protein
MFSRVSWSVGQPDMCRMYCRVAISTRALYRKLPKNNKVENCYTGITL